LRQEIVRKRVFVILGAGVSLASTNNHELAGWKGLLGNGINFCEEIDLRLPPGWGTRRRSALEQGDLTELLGVAEEVEHRLREKGKYTKWANQLGSLPLVDPQVLKAVEALGLRIATTNYDNLITDVMHLDPVTLRDWDRALGVLKGDELGVLHLHGHFRRPESMVLGIVSYDRHIGNKPIQALQEAMTFSNTLLFVGFGDGLDDPNFHRLRDWLRNVFGGERKHYRLCLEKERDALDKEGTIAPIAYGTDWHELAPFLRALKPTSLAGGLAGSDAPSNIAAPARCDDRGGEIKKLIERLVPKAGGGLALVYGGPGFGKTTVTQRVGVDQEICDRFGPRRWFVNLETVQAETGVVEIIAVTIGLERTAGKGAVFAQLGTGPALLVLDNLETPWHADQPGIEMLLNELRNLPTVAVIVSLRGMVPLPGVRWDAEIQLEPLKAEPSKKLFLDIAKTISSGDPDLDFFLEWAAGIPLAIYLIAACVSGSARLDRLRQHWKRYGPEVVTKEGSQGKREGDLAACIEFSLKSPALKEAGRRLFRLLGQLPAGIGRDDEDALLGRDAPFAARQLRLLGLVLERESRIDLLPPIRDVARKYPPTDADQRWFDHYIRLAREQSEQVGKSGGAAAAVRLTEEFPNIGAAIQQLADSSTGRAEAITLLAGGLTEAMRYSTFAAEPMLDALAARCVRDKDCRGEAACLIARAMAAHNKGDYPGAFIGFRNALDKLRGAADDKLEADCFLGLGRIAQNETNYEQARSDLQEARKRYARTSWSKGEPDCRWELGEIARIRDDFEESDSQFTKALALYESSGWLDGSAGCYWGLAEIASKQPKRLEEARVLYGTARALYERIGWRAGLAHCLKGLSKLAEAEGNRDEASRLDAEAEVLFRKTAKPG
jgi:tetratricopeptide (TPR) repeat protein